MKKLHKILILLFVLSPCINAQNHQSMSAHSDFEGSSVKIISIDQETNTIRFQPGGNPSRGWPCWWYFRVDGVKPGASVKIVLDNPSVGSWAKPNRATYSTDGINWHHTILGIKAGNNLTPVGKRYY